MSPSATAWAASSAELHRASGTSRAAGGSQAIALTSATTSAGNGRGRPDRARSPNPWRRWSWNRLRQRDTTSTHTSSRAAITVFGWSSPASSTIFARTTSACDEV